MTLNLNPEEQAWLEEYRQELRRRYPGIIADLRVFDSREQKNPAPKRTVAVAVLLQGCSDHDQAFADLNWLADSLVKGAEVTPIVHVHTRAQWERSLRRNALSYKSAGQSVWEKDRIADIPGEEWALPPWARPDSWRLHLKPYEKEWLADYRQALREKYPELVKDLRVFARHDCAGHTAGGSLNLVVTLKGGVKERPLTDSVKNLGYGTWWNPTFPAIAIYTEEEWQQGQREDTLPYYGGGVSVWLP